jgi:hypothetical protein
MVIKTPSALVQAGVCSIQLFGRQKGSVGKKWASSSDPLRLRCWRFCRFPLLTGKRQRWNVRETADKL